MAMAGLYSTQKVADLTIKKSAKALLPAKRLPYQLGKLPASGTAKLQLADYLTPHLLPDIPDNFGHELLVGDWGVLGNATWGDCAIAGPYHSLQLWNAEGANQVNISEATVLNAYGEVTDFREDAGPPGENPTDQGTNCEVMCEYWQKFGFKDDDGAVHKIDGYVALQPGNLTQLWAAAYLFDGMGVGIEFPREWMDAFSIGQAWDTIDHPHVAGGHYVTGVGRRNGNLVVVTWGQLQQMTPAGYEQFCDEAFIYVDTDKLIHGKDINGFDLDTLRRDMWEVAQCEERHAQENLQRPPDGGPPHEGGDDLVETSRVNT
jgi:hypothetical protein